MDPTPVTAAVVRCEAVFEEEEQLAVAGFLAGYRGLTREAYALDLRQFIGFCSQVGLGLFQIRRVHIESFARALEERARARATVAGCAPWPASTATPSRRG